MCPPASRRAERAARRAAGARAERFRAATRALRSVPLKPAVSVHAARRPPMGAPLVAAEAGEYERRARSRHRSPAARGRTRRRAGRGRTRLRRGLAEAARAKAAVRADALARPRPLPYLVAGSRNHTLINPAPRRGHAHPRSENPRRGRGRGPEATRSGLGAWGSGPVVLPSSRLPSPVLPSSSPFSFGRGEAPS